MNRLTFWSRFRISIVVLMGLVMPLSQAVPVHAAAAATPGAAIFAAEKPVEFKIEITPKDLESLRDEPRKDIRAQVRAGSGTFTNVAVHLKGRRGSFRTLDDKPSLTLTFDQFTPGQRYEGLSRIHLNNSVEDPSYLHERLGSELFQAAGLPATRTGYAMMELNGRKMGLFVLKEGFTEEFLGLHFKSTKGNLYENTPDDDEPGTMKRNSGSGPEDQSDHKALLEAAAEPGHARRWDRLEQVLDMDRFLTFMAVEVMSGHRDGYCLAWNNYRLYFDPASGRCNVLPHGMDNLFGRADLPLRANMSGPLARAVMEMPQGRRLYLERAASLLTNVFKAEALTNRVNALVAQLRPALSGSASAELEEHSASVRERITKRIAGVAKQLREPELKPLKFDQDAVKLTAWKPVDPPEGGKLEVSNGADGRASLHAVAGPTTSASWRTNVLLSAGRYRFEGEIRTAGVKPLPFGKNKGAGLRASAAKRAVPNQMTGDVPWTKQTVEFELSEPETAVELVCELRASAGEAWFGVDSLRLVKLK